MITALIIVGCLVAYFAIGYRLVHINANAMWRKAKKNWDFDKTQRESVKAQTMLWLLVWPLMLPTAGLSSLGDHIVDRYDPKRWEREAKEQRKQMAAQQRQIAELERELGLNNN